MFDFAKAQVGKQYIFGAVGPNAFDCSGLTLKAFAAAGVKLPRIAQAQYTATKKYSVSRADLRKGDLLFFDTIKDNGVAVDHVGIYWGNDKMLHAPNPKKRVGIYDLGGNDGYYWPKLVGATRPLQQVKTVASGSSASVGDWQFPLAKRYAVTSKYGMRTHPLTGVYKLHDGTDFGAPFGAPIRAVANGTAKTAGWASGYGNYVTVAHNGGKVVTGYAHMSRIAVRAGETVRKGQVIGYVGNTGLSGGYHLHFSVRVIGHKGLNGNGHSDWVNSNSFITDAGYRAQLLGTRNDFVSAA